MFCDANMYCIGFFGSNNKGREIIDGNSSSTAVLDTHSLATGTRQVLEPSSFLLFTGLGMAAVREVMWENRWDAIYYEIA